MQKKMFVKWMMKLIAVVLCLLTAMISMCACNSDAPAPAPSADIPSTDSVDYIQEETKDEVEETEPQMLGRYADISLYHGFFIKYPDGSFDTYEQGTVINWGQPGHYTYGTERCPANVVLSASKDTQNMEMLKNGTLVFKTSNSEKVQAGIYPVIESGYAMSGKNTDGDWETLFWFDEIGNEFWVVDGTRIDPEYRWNFSRLRDIISINGMTPGDTAIFEKEDDKMYVTLQLGDTYVIGEADGTTLVESEYTVNKKYYLSTMNFNEQSYEYSEKQYSLELQPTADGYAVVDLTEIPAGDYIITYSYWHEDRSSRMAYITHVRVE